MSAEIYYIEIRTRYENGKRDKLQCKLANCDWSPNMSFEDTVNDHLNTMWNKEAYNLLFTLWKSCESEYTQLRQLLYVHDPNKHPAIYEQPSLQTIMQYKVNF